MNLRQLLVATVVSLLSASSASAGTSSSTSYVLHQSTINSGGSVSSSASFVLTGSAGQESAVGASSAGTSFVLQSGFWSFAGSGLVPVVLTVDRNPVTPSNIDLEWSGNNAPYDIFRAGGCADVLSSYLDSTSSNDYDDIPPLPSSLECFNVLATAPGPPPPQRSSP